MNIKRSTPLVLVAGTMIFAMLLASFQAAQATHPAVPILAMPSVSEGQIKSSANIYQEPEISSKRLTVLPAGNQVHILGFNENGTWIAFAKENQSALDGWISAADVNFDLAAGSTRALVKAYQQPDSSSAVTAVFAPAAKLQIYGHNPEHNWFAVADPAARQASVKWVAFSDLQLPDVMATTSALTKLYLRPDSKSKLTTVLPPAQNVVLIGRDSAGSWFAAADMQSKQFIGWAQISDLKADSNRSLLPVIPVR